MRDWFAPAANQPFVPFHFSHNIMILLFILGVGLVAVYTKRLSLKKKNVRWLLFWILIISEISYQFWGILNGTWNSREFLPFQLCSVAGIMAAIALFTNNIKLIQILFFIGIVPPFFAVVTPELFHGYTHYRYWQFFIHHIILACATVFLVVSRNIQISLKNTLESYISLLAYAAIIGYLINPLFNANFLFLSNPPSISTPIILFDEGMFYFVNLCIIGFFTFILLFAVFKLVNKYY